MPIGDQWPNHTVPTKTMRICNCVGPQDGAPVCPCQMGDYLQRQAEREAWMREQARIVDRIFRGKKKPRVRVKAISRPLPAPPAGGRDGE
ncbi:MAG: hypothetical protein ABFE07_06430 [Armatimonadia bacterium]